MRTPLLSRLALRLAAVALVATAAVPAAATPQGVIANWQPILIGSTGGFFPDGTIDSPFRVTVDPVNASTVYFGTGAIPTPGVVTPADGFWKTTDGGTTWTQKNEPSTGDPGLDFYEFTADTSVLDIAVCKSNPSVVAVATNVKGFFKSTDGGNTWAWVSGGIVHTDNDGDHCGAIAHADQRFDTVNGRWAGTTVAFDPRPAAACNVMYAGAGDVNAIDIGAGTGDHPGMYKTSDGGTTWTELNTNLRPRVDAIDCHTFNLTSKTIAPISTKVDAADGDVVLATTEQAADASIGGKSATSQLKVWHNPAGSGSWTQMSSGLEASRITQTASLSELTAISISAGFLAPSPAGNFYVSSHIGFGIKILLSGDDVTKNRGTGIYASQTLASWVARDAGIPIATDPDNQNAQNVAGISIRPNQVSLWSAGTFDADAAGADASQVYASADFGGAWINTNAFFGGLSTSPTGLTEASVFFVEWDAAGRCMYATVLWDFGNTTTVDDGVYKVCVF